MIDCKIEIILHRSLYNIYHGKKEYGEMFSLYIWGRTITFVGKEYTHEVLSRSDVFDFGVLFRKMIPGDVMYTSIDNFGDLRSYGKMIRGSSISNKLNLYTERIQKSLYLATQKHIGDCNDQKVIYNIYSAITKIISASIANVFIGEEESEYDDVISTFAEFTKDIAVFFLIPPIFDLIFPGLQDFVKRIPIRLGLYNPVTRHVNTLIKHVKHQVDKRLREKQKYGDSWKRPTDLLQDFMEQKSHVVDIYSYDTYHDESLQGPNPTSFEPHRHNVPASKVGRNFLTFGGGKHM
ncbi:unnamed protein product [Rhizophagus irregularis]|nr:unnamed protein product [Rhizophagus irregularis]